MGRFLNNKEPYDKYKTVMNGTYFVDKSEILEELIPALQQEQRFFCITRPRRFGKTVMANMIAAFFENIGEKSLFDDLQIAGYEKYKEHVGQHDVIYIDFSEMPRECSNYHEYISRIQDGIISDMIENYPEIDIKKDMAVWDILSWIFNNTGHKFIFIMDEWDAVFHMSFINEKDRENYLLFLKLLLKGQSYVKLAYMTGVLPIAKYSDGSELNMFLEYNMATRVRFSEYFGFLIKKWISCMSVILKIQKIPRSHGKASENGMMVITRQQGSGFIIHAPWCVRLQITSYQITG